MQGESVRNTHHLAQLLYLQNVRSLYQKNPEGFKMQEALSYDSIQANAWKLEKNPAFKKAINHFDMSLPSAQAQSQVYTNYVNYKIAENRQPQENAQHQQENAQRQQVEPQVQGPGVGQR
jgi:type II secretory pathway component PulJ